MMHMAEPVTHALKEKIDKAAYAKAQIKTGQFDWSKTDLWQGKGTPKHNDGTPRAPVKVLLEAGGWNPNSNDAISHLKTNYFEERYAFHMQRMDGGFKKALAELTDGGNALAMLSTNLWESLMADLQDPERAKRIPFRDRATLYEKVTEMQAKLKGDASTRNRSSVTIGNVLNVMSESMPEDQFRNMANRLERVHDDVVDIVEGVIVVADAEDES